MSNEPETQPDPSVPSTIAPEAEKKPAEPEIGGPKGLEPTRYGDWTVKGRCIDF
ncbi:DUF1674 domain-containing protein [Lichenicola cladoniae]|uniref:DUF1674 domain-containing protein n=1 Tax=Lichenicola cladoniae TaxID=1484109 RepID=A0A6M8HMD2_9PROT|nr:succinate dehydrogenase assembly factor 4 [Lichenicola cladoniae]NPD66910.1 DUF1674 domain-containing protein [Acetobacteraceae bacterium]QKE89466.1 DUF1674 domain-containing protein [Lichenicola cladoniae]